MELETQQQARQASGRRTQLKLGRDIKLPSVRKLPLVRRRALPVRVIGAESVPALSAALLLPAHPALVALALLVALAFCSISVAAPTELALVNEWVEGGGPLVSGRRRVLFVRFVLCVAAALYFFV